MTFAFAAGPFFAFMLALVRASAWLAFVPPFSSNAIPLVVRFGLGRRPRPGRHLRTEPCPGPGWQVAPR